VDETPAAPPPADQPPAGDRSPRDGRTFLRVVLVSLVLVGALWGIARGAPSATQLDAVALPTPKITADEGCATFARYWMVDSGAGVPASAIAAIGNCYQTAEGEWFVPVGAADRRLAVTFALDDSERDATQAVRERIRSDIVALEKLLSTGLREQLQRNYDVRNLPVTGHTKWGAERRSLGPTQGRYVRLTQAFLMSPERVWLADYVGWRMGNRIEGAAAFESACLGNPDLEFLERACSGLRSDLGLEAIPFIWELNDPVALAQYLDQLAASGRPLASPVPDGSAT